MPSGWYVYGILSSQVVLPSVIQERTGFDGAPVVAIRCHDLMAATSATSASSVRPTPENLLQHEEVVEALQLSGPLLPVRFGTVMADAGGVVEAMAQRYATLVADLARLGHKVELGLTVLWSPDGTNGEESGEWPGEEASGGNAPPVGAGTRYIRERLIEYRREAVLRTRAQAIARDVDNTLRSHALESTYSILPTPRLAARAAYLLEPSKVGAFRGAFEELRAARPSLQFLLSGPWPPYSFVTRTSAGSPV